MGDMKVVNQPTTTLFSKVVNSKPAEFAKENPTLAGAGVVGSGIIVAEAARRSDVVATVLKKGVVPAVSAGAAVLGVSMIKDAIQNDLPKAGLRDRQETPEQALEEQTANAKLAGKLAGGAVLAVAGTEVAGRTAFGFSPFGKAAELITHVIPGEAIPFAVLGTGGLAMGALGAKNIKENGLTIGNAAATGGGAFLMTAMSGHAVWEAFQFTPASGAIIDIANKANGFVGGAALGLGAVALGKTSMDAIKEGKSGKAVLTAVGATTAGAAAVHLMGNATGIEALSNLGQKVFLKNPLLAGAITATTMAGVGYYLYQKNHP